MNYVRLFSKPRSSTKEAAKILYDVIKHKAAVTRGSIISVKPKDVGRDDLRSAAGVILRKLVSMKLAELRSENTATVLISKDKVGEVLRILENL